MGTGPTLYDTDYHLEPVPWSLEHADKLGLVALDADRSATLFTIVGKKRDDGAPGYLLSMGTYSDNTVVEVDGEIALVIDEGTLAGLNPLIELAQRARDESQLQVESTRSYSEEDINAADDAWHLAQKTIETIQGA